MYFTAKRKYILWLLPSQRTMDAKPVRFLSFYSKLNINVIHETCCVLKEDFPNEIYFTTIYYILYLTFFNVDIYNSFINKITNLNRLNIKMEKEKRKKKRKKKRNNQKKKSPHRRHFFVA